MTYDPFRPIGPLPMDRIITREEAERQAKAMLEKIHGRPAPRPAPPVYSAPEPLGYVVVARKRPDDDWRVWSILVAETRQEVQEDLRLARRRYGPDGARAAVIYPLEAPDGEE